MKADISDAPERIIRGHHKHNVLYDEAREDIRKSVAAYNLKKEASK